METKRVFAGVGVFLVLLAGAQAAEKSKVVTKAKRGIAATGPAIVLSTQGESMLQTERGTAPRFLERGSPSTPVRVLGVCRDSSGMTHTSREPGYSTCLDAQTHQSGTSVHDYFGPAQRQAGVGISVGR